MTEPQYLELTENGAPNECETNESSKLVLDNEESTEKCGTREAERCLYSNLILILLLVSIVCLGISLRYQWAQVRRWLGPRLKWRRLIHRHTHTHAQTRTNTHTHKHARAHTHTHTNTHTHTHTHTHIRPHTYAHTRTHTHMYTHLFTFFNSDMLHKPRLRIPGSLKNE